MARIRGTKRDSLLSKKGALFGKAKPKEGTRLKKNGEPCKQPRARNGRKALREIMMFQGTTRRSTMAPKKKDPATCLLFTKAGFEREVKKTTREITNQPVRFQADAIKALQSASEAYLQQVFTEASWIGCYANRKSVNHCEVAIGNWVLSTQPYERNALTFPVEMPGMSHSYTRVVKNEKVVEREGRKKMSTTVPHAVPGEQHLSKADKLKKMAAMKKKHVEETEEDNANDESEQESDGEATDASTASN